jgi:hypothetical protein
MSSSLDQVLERAFELIENDRQGEALSIIEPLINDYPDNPDVWWLYVHAVENKDKAREALDRILVMDPTYPGAVELSQSFGEAPIGQIKRIGKMVPQAGAPTTLPDMPETDDLDFDLSEDWDDQDFDLEDDTKPEKRSRRRLLLPLLVLVLIVVIVGVVLVLTSSKKTATKATPTASAQVSVPTATTVSEDTAIPPTTQPATVAPSDTPVPPTIAASSAGSEFSDIAAALSAFDIPDQGIEIVQTDLGDTLRVTACADRSQLAAVMAIVADKSQALTNEIGGIAVNIGDCSAPDSMRAIGVGMSDVLAYLDGSLSEQDFRRLWKPVG